MTSADDSLSTTSQVLSTFPMSCGAGVFGLAVAVLGLVAVAFQVRFTFLFFLWAILACASGIAIALLERGSTKSLVLLGLALIVLGGVDLLQAYNQHIFVWTISGLALITFLPAFVACLLVHAGFSAGKSLLILSLVSFVAFVGATTIPGILIFGMDETGQQYVLMTLGFLFGPWATHAIRWTSFPNAGEFFNLPWALAFAALLGAALCTILRKPSLLAFGIMPFAWLLMGWFGAALVQLVECLNKSPFL